MQTPPLCLLEGDAVPVIFLRYLNGSGTRCLLCWCGRPNGWWCASGGFCDAALYAGAV